MKKFNEIKHINAYNKVVKEMGKLLKQINKAKEQGDQAQVTELMMLFDIADMRRKLLDIEYGQFIKSKKKNG